MSNAPRLHVAPRAADTYGDLAANLAGDYGLTPDDWQQLILDDWLAETKGRWTSLTCGLSVPRQNGKNGALEVRELFGMIGRGEKILHTAHQVKTAQKHFRRLKHFFGKKADDPSARFPELNALVAELRNVNGQEAIFLKNGGSVEIVARSQGSGRGFTVDVIVCDEAQDMSDDDLEALLSTSSAGPLQNPQWIFTGTPPGPKANGEVFTRVRDDALGDKPERICWHEWSCDEETGVDLDDPAEWRRANPALGTRLQLDVVKGERARFSDGGFMRERLGMWATQQQSASPIPAVVWEALSTQNAPALNVPPGALGVDRWYDGATSVAAAWRQGEATHIELVAADVVSSTSGIVDWIVERAGRKIPVLIASDSPAASMAVDLRARNVRVSLVTTGDYGRACGSFLDDALDEGRLSHADQKNLNDAVASARKRDIGKAGAWGWDRSQPDADISGLVAATLARAGAIQTKPKTGRVVTA